MAQTNPIRPLSRYKVLDLTMHISGPMCTRTLAENGAEVVKVEPPGGDNSRHVPVIKDGRSGYFVGLNRGKQSLCLDLKNAAGLEIVKQMLPRFDVMVENFAPGVIGRLGLGYDVVKSINPAIVMCSISTFGQTGPLAPKPGYDYIAASYAGVINTLGFPDSSPVLPGLAMGDSMTAMNSYGAIFRAVVSAADRGGSAPGYLSARFLYAVLGSCRAIGESRPGRIQDHARRPALQQYAADRAVQVRTALHLRDGAA
jgi:crotonobetainyl-CoA:carnitine CoA-transferase CaiB-like acyl-CoA transferase